MSDAVLEAMASVRNEMAVAILKVIERAHAGEYMPKGIGGEARDAALSAAAEMGWKMAPSEATEEMHNDGWKALQRTFHSSRSRDHTTSIWSAMFRAAPALGGDDG